jgi:hypothetical protein
MVNFEATSETMLLPGDVVEVKPKLHNPANIEVPSTEAEENSNLSPASSLAEGSASPSR